MSIIRHLNCFQACTSAGGARSFAVRARIYAGGSSPYCRGSRSCSEALAAACGLGESQRTEEETAWDEIVLHGMEVLCLGHSRADEACTLHFRTIRLCGKGPQSAPAMDRVSSASAAPRTRDLGRAGRRRQPTRTRRRSLCIAGHAHTATVTYRLHYRRQKVHQIVHMCP